MFASLVLLAAVYAASATTVSLFPVEFGPSDNLQGEIVGSGGSVGTTFVLSGAESDIPFTLTIAEDASQLAETVNIPTLSLALAAGCVLPTAGATNAICQNVIHEDGMTLTQTVTVAFSPFAVAVSTSGVSASSTPSSASGSGSGVAPSTAITSTTAISTSVVSATSASASVSASILSSITPSVPQSTISPSTSSTASLTSPSSSASPTSGATASSKLSGVAAVISLGLAMLAMS